MSHLGESEQQRDEAEEKAAQEHRNRYKSDNQPSVHGDVFFFFFFFFFVFPLTRLSLRTCYMSSPAAGCRSASRHRGAFSLLGILLLPRRASRPANLLPPLPPPRQQHTPVVGYWSATPAPPIIYHHSPPPTKLQAHIILTTSFLIGSDVSRIQSTKEFSGSQPQGRDPEGVTCFCCFIFFFGSKSFPLFLVMLYIISPLRAFQNEAERKNPTPAVKLSKPVEVSSREQVDTCHAFTLEERQNQVHSSTHSLVQCAASQTLSLMGPCFGKNVCDS